LTFLFAQKFLSFRELFFLVLVTFRQL